MRGKSNMMLFRGLSSSNILRPSVAAIGNFDGLHVGHNNILKKLLEIAAQEHLPATVITFEPLPVNFFKPELSIFRLTSLAEKLTECSKRGIHQLLSVRFDHDMAMLSAQAFVQILLGENLQLKHVVVGEDFRFGRARQGDVELLKTLGAAQGLSVHAQPLVMVENERVSSTHIREALLRGECEQASKMLGRPYQLTRRVVRGAQRGRIWGIPTANILFSPHRVLLRGTFITRVLVDNRVFWAVTNSGTRPSVGGTRHVVESHLLDFSENLYGKRITIAFYHKMRDEQRFEDITLLQARIREDICYARTWIAQFTQTALIAM